MATDQRPLNSDGVVRGQAPTKSSSDMAGWKFAAMFAYLNVTSWIRHLVWKIYSDKWSIVSWTGWTNSIKT